MAVRLVVGLGNPGERYRETRHNAGADFVEALARRYGAELRPKSKFSGRAGDLRGGGMELRLLIPDTYMNESGRSVSAAAKFHDLDPAEILIAHDELDFEPGVARFKRGGGHGGHNGLRDVSKALGDAYLRLRIGIGHPRYVPGTTSPGATNPGTKSPGTKDARREGSGEDPGDYVLKRASAEQRRQIEDSIEAAIDALPALVSGDWAAATRQLHGQESHGI